MRNPNDHEPRGLAGTSGWRLEGEAAARTLPGIFHRPRKGIRNDANKLERPGALDFLCAQAKPLILLDLRIDGRGPARVEGLIYWHSTVIGATIH